MEDALPPLPKGRGFRAGNRMKRGMPLGRAAVVFGMMNLVLAVAAGFVLFKERLTIFQWAGAVLALLSVVMMEW